MINDGTQDFIAHVSAVIAPVVSRMLEKRQIVVANAHGTKDMRDGFALKPRPPRWRHHGWLRGSGRFLESFLSAE
jgi:hypothetical protein